MCAFKIGFPFPRPATLTTKCSTVLTALYGLWDIYISAVSIDDDDDDGDNNEVDSERERRLIAATQI